VPARSFVKRLPLPERWRLEAEADGLARLAAAGAIRVPRVLGLGSSESEAWLELEWFDLHAPDAASDERMGEALARLHAVTGASFGLERDNAIGPTPQPNAPTPDWAGFWRDPTAGCASSSSWRRATATAAGCRSAGNGYWSASAVSSPATIRGPRCCTATCGAATAPRSATARR
jgi:fructosamine-3-kinase